MLESFDFLYMPSRDVARDLAFYVRVLGGEIVFAIEAFGTRVAQVDLGTGGGPGLLLAGHLEGEAPVLVYRVGDLETTVEGLEAAGGEIGLRFEFPHGPAAELRTPGGQRIAVYELTRPEVAERLKGRRDFDPS